MLGLKKPRVGNKALLEAEVEVNRDDQHQANRQSLLMQCEIGQSGGYS